MWPRHGISPRVVYIIWSGLLILQMLIVAFVCTENVPLFAHNVKRKQLRDETLARRTAYSSSANATSERQPQQRQPQQRQRQHQQRHVVVLTSSTTKRERVLQPSAAWKHIASRIKLVDYRILFEKNIIVSSHNTSHTRSTVSSKHLKGRELAKAQQMLDVGVVWSAYASFIQKNHIRIDYVLWVEDDFALCGASIADWDAVFAQCENNATRSVVHAAHGFSMLAFTTESFLHWASVLSKRSLADTPPIDVDMAAQWGAYLAVYRWNLAVHHGDHTSTLETTDIADARAHLLTTCLAVNSMSMVARNDYFRIYDCEAHSFSRVSVHTGAITCLVPVWHVLSERALFNRIAAEAHDRTHSKNAEIILGEAHESCTAACGRKEKRCGCEHFAMLASADVRQRWCTSIEISPFANMAERANDGSCIFPRRLESQRCDTTAQSYPIRRLCPCFK